MRANNVLSDVANRSRKPCKSGPSLPFKSVADLGLQVHVSSSSKGCPPSRSFLAECLQEEKVSKALQRMEEELKSKLYSINQASLLACSRRSRLKSQADRTTKDETVKDEEENKEVNQPWLLPQQQQQQQQQVQVVCQEGTEVEVVSPREKVTTASEGDSLSIQKDASLNESNESTLILIPEKQTHSQVSLDISYKQKPVSALISFL